MKSKHMPETGCYELDPELWEPDPWDEGLYAGMCDIGQHKNPFTPGSGDHRLWLDGWREGKLSG